MEIYPFDKTFEENVTLDDIQNINADGITIRSGNKVIKLQVTEETVVDDTDAIRQEFAEKFQALMLKVKSDGEDYKNQLKYAFDKERDKLERKEKELQRRMSETSVLPELKTEHLHAGLAVALAGHGRLLWSFKTVYAPKYINERRIDPTFAKRLVTPICIEVTTNAESRCIGLHVRQILGGKKFHHYHSMSNSSDCWGDFRYDGVKLNGPEDVIEFCKKAAGVLEVINEMSIGTRNPRGLSRLDTVKKHRLKRDDTVEVDEKKSAANSRNTRAGVDMVEAQQPDQNVWST